MNQHSLQFKILQLIYNPKFKNFITAIIIFNAITLGLETSPTVMQHIGSTIKILDSVVLSIFIIEIILKIFAKRSYFFCNAWDWFDFTIITTSLLTYGTSLSALRAFRIIRVLRLIAVFPSLQMITSSLLGAIPGVLSISSMILIVFYVFAVLSTNFFGADFYEWFGTIGKSMYSLFQIMTLESWSMGIVRPVMKIYPNAWMLFVPYVIIATFTMMNLFIALIVHVMDKQGNALSEKLQQEEQQNRDNIIEELLTEVRELKQILQNKNLNSP